MIYRIVVEAAAQLGVELKCNICGSIQDTLVRDHNHVTGMIRGILCELCNNWVGVYESKKISLPRKHKRKYRIWVSTFCERIEAHIKISTNIRYLSPSALRKLRVRTEGGHASASVPRAIRGVRFV